MPGGSRRTRHIDGCGWWPVCRPPKATARATRCTARDIALLYEGMLNAMAIPLNTEPGRSGHSDGARVAGRRLIAVCEARFDDRE
jgi:hypothetical protein